MFKLIKRFLIFLLVVLAIFSFFYWRSVKNKPNFDNKESQYKKTRDELLSILNKDEFEVEAFKEFLNKLPPYRLDRWPREFWYSITFADPRGGITTYQDIMMGVALGVDRLWQQEDPTFEIEKKVTDIISRRVYVWHDFSWENHYAREYAALAALAQVIGDPRFDDFQSKLHNSLEKIFLSDGSSQEGVSYGFYTIKMLSPYVYLTGDQKVKRYIDNFYKWAANVAARDGSLPPFDDSLLLKLPQKVSYFSLVNNLNENSQVAARRQDYFGQNESVFKRDDLTVWIRHKKKLSGKTYHQHFSSADLMVKGKNVWWLIPSGYDHTNNLNRPVLHNLAIRKAYDTIWWWKFLSFLGKDFSTRVLSDNSGVVKMETYDKIKREVAVGDDALVVLDKSDKPFNLYWQVMGSLEKAKRTDNGISLLFKQGDEALLVYLQGFDSIEFKKVQHALVSWQKEEHIQIHLTGKDITSEFLLQSQ